jgi:hypothetical protein
MPTHHTGLLSLLRHRRLAFVAAGTLAGSQWSLQLALAHGAPIAVLAVGGQLTALAAVFWCAAGLTTVGSGEYRRLTGYVASLVVVFGADMVAGVIEWIWLPPCRAGTGGVGGRHRLAGNSSHPSGAEPVSGSDLPTCCRTRSFEAVASVDFQPGGSSPPGRA